MSWAAKLIHFAKACFVTAALALWPLTFVLTFNPSFFAKPQTIFAFDYQARQLVLRNTYAYPNVLLARIFQNKAQIPLGKFEHNLTALIDPNNYFFGFHPREILSGNKNAVKFPFVALPVFLVGFFTLSRHRHHKLILAILVAMTVGLSALASFDGYDFLLYFPLAIVFLHGLKKIPPLYLLLALPISLIEIARQLIIFFPK